MKFLSLLFNDFIFAPTLPQFSLTVSRASKIILSENMMTVMGKIMRLTPLIIIPNGKEHPFIRRFPAFTDGQTRPKLSSRRICWSNLLVKNLRIRGATPPSPISLQDVVLSNGSGTNYFYDLCMGQKYGHRRRQILVNTVGSRNSTVKWFGGKDRKRGKQETEKIRTFKINVSTDKPINIMTF
jgi:hypothetical protein